MTLTDNFLNLQKAGDSEGIVRLMENAPESAERDGLMALMYHEGIGVEADLDRCFELTEKAVDGGDALGYFLLGYMCDNVETPDQADSGPRQQYDHYDAERFYEICAGKDSPWRDEAVLWLGEHFMNMAAGGDPETGVEYYESIAPHNAEAAARLSDYYWNLIMPEYLEDEEWEAQLLTWTEVAARFRPEEYNHRMGWIYADGIGCEASADKAIEYFELATLAGDWRGPAAVAKVYEEFMDAHPDLDEDERNEFLSEIERCKKMSDEMYEASAAGEPDSAVDDD